MPKKIDPELRARAVRLVMEQSPAWTMRRRCARSSVWAWAMSSPLRKIAAPIGISPWLRPSAASSSAASIASTAPITSALLPVSPRARSMQGLRLEPALI